MKKITLLLALILCATTSHAEVVSRFEVNDGKAGYPCNLTMISDTDRKISLHLSDYKNVWQVTVIADHVAKTLKSQGLIDRRKASQAISKLAVDSKQFDLDEFTTDIIVRGSQDDFDDKRVAIANINTEYSVSQVAKSMENADAIAIPNLLKVTGAKDAFRHFSECTQGELGLEKGELADFDSRAAYRNLFDKNFGNWVAAGSTASSCLVAKFPDSDIDEMLERAASAFFPGLLNYSKRTEYKKGMALEISMSKMIGSVDAVTGKCATSTLLLSGYSAVLEKTIEGAADSK